MGASGPDKMDIIISDAYFGLLLIIYKIYQLWSHLHSQLYP